MDTDEVLVVIVTFNSEDHIVPLLESLPRGLEGLRYNTVVVDNGSQDRTVELVSRRQDCELIRSTNAGFAAGLNSGVRGSESEGPILILNPDTVLDPSCVSALGEAMRRSGCGIVVPRIRSSDGAIFPSIRRRPTLLRVGGLSFTGLGIFAERVEVDETYSREQPVDWATGAVMLIDRLCYNHLDGFDESYFLYSEETDFCLRAMDAGWSTVYTPRAGAMHVGGGSGRSAKTHTMQMVNRVRLYRRRSGPVRGFLYLAGSIVVEVRRAILGDRASVETALALALPKRRPIELAASNSVVPR